jgi:hypothetical protein
MNNLYAVPGVCDGVLQELSDRLPHFLSILVFLLLLKQDLQRVTVSRHRSHITVSQDNRFKTYPPLLSLTQTPHGDVATEEGFLTSLFLHFSHWPQCSSNLHSGTPRPISETVLALPSLLQSQPHTR